MSPPIPPEAPTFMLIAPEAISLEPDLIPIDPEVTPSPVLSLKAPPSPLMEDPVVLTISPPFPNPPDPDRS